MNDENPQLKIFFDDIINGKYGVSDITHDEVDLFLKIATPSQLNELDDYFWNWTSELTIPGEIDIDEFCEFFYDCLNQDLDN